MKIGDLISALQALKEKHGDLVVKGVFDCGSGVPSEIEDVYRSCDGWAAVDLDGMGRGRWGHPDDVPERPDDAAT